MNKWIIILAILSLTGCQMLEERKEAKRTPLGHQILVHYSYGVQTNNCYNYGQDLANGYYLYDSKCNLIKEIHLNNKETCEIVTIWDADTNDISWNEYKWKEMENE